MSSILRHSLAILLLPFVAVVVVPFLLLNAAVLHDSIWHEATLSVWVTRSSGVVLAIFGFALFCRCVSLFAKVGKGTLAPWDPTQKLVAHGPYRVVRNPMISAVALVLLGQSLFWGSWAIFIWVCVFVSVNHVYFVLSEEPGLEQRFGEDYRIYKARVPRWLPRMNLRVGRQVDD